MKVVKIVAKTLRMIMRSKTSLAAVLLGPLLIITLVGLAFGNITQYSLNIGVFAHDYNELVESYLDAIEDDSTYQISRYPLIDNCINDIRRGSAHTCIEFPRDFRIGTNGSNEIKFYVDQSKTDMVEIIRNVVVERLSRRTAEISEERTEDVLSRVQAVDNIINEQAVVLQDISSKLRSTEDKLDDAISGFEYLNNLITGAGDRMDDIDDLSRDMLNYAEDLKEEAHDAVSIGLSWVPVNDSDYAQLENIHTRATNLYNDSFDARIDMLNMIRDDRDGSSEIDSRFRSVGRDMDDALSYVGETIDLLGGVGSAFAQASDDFAGIDGAENITAPVRTRLEPVVAERAPLSYMFPTLLVMVIMLVSVMLAGTLVVVEKSSSSFFRNFVTPTSDIAFISGIFISNILVTFFQSLLIILVASFVFGGVMLTNLLTIAVALLIISALFTLLGMLLGYLFNTQEMVSLSGITISSLFIMLSGIIIPLEQMPEYMIRYSIYNPLLMGEGILRRSIIFQTELINEAIMRDVFLIVGFSIILLILVIFTQKIKKEIFLNGSRLFRRRRVSEEEQPESNGDNKNKGKRGLDFLEDYVGEEKQKEKSVVVSKIKKKIGSIGFISKISSKFRFKAKEEDIVYTGDEEMTYGADSDDYENMGSSEDSLSDDDSGESSESFDDDSSNKKTKKSFSLRPTRNNQKKAKISSKSSSTKKSTSTKSVSTKSTSGEKTSNNDSISEVEYHPIRAEKLEPYQYFVLSSGVIVKSFATLIDELMSMDDDTFEYHVGDDRNDFYLWIKNVLKQEKAADKIRKVKDPKKMAKILKKFTR